MFYENLQRCRQLRWHVEDLLARLAPVDIVFLEGFRLTCTRSWSLSNLHEIGG
jgi:molybdopterin-guanine dinucleotide biosynthesis protein